jgi:transglutaminase-like putative cysteine protease
MNRRTGAILILASWVASLGWLGVRQSRAASEIGLEGRRTRLAPLASFYAVLAGDVQIGTAGITLDTTALGYRLIEVLSLDLPGPTPARDVLRLESVLSRTLRLQQATASLSEEGTSFSLEARPGPDSGFVLRTGRQGVNRDVLEWLPPVPGITVAGATPYQLAASGRLRPRGSIAAPILDLLVRSFWTGLAEVTADSVLITSDSAAFDPGTGRWVAAAPDSVRAWQVVRRERGLPVREWIDAQGRVLRRDYAFGLTLARSPFEVNFTNYQSGRRNGRPPPTPQLSGTVRLVDRERGPDTTVGTVRLVVRRLDGPAWPGSAAGFAGGRQSSDGDTVVIRREPAGVDPATPTRWRNTPASPPTDSAGVQRALEEALKANPGEPDTLRRLVHWVAHGVRYLDRQTTPTGISTVLRDKRAGVDGKVALLVALARQAGFPARAVAGVDVSDTTLPAHAWVEVWRNGWQAVDPVYGNVPASAYLLRVTEGAGAHPLVLVPLVGGLRTALLSPAPGNGRR